MQLEVSSVEKSCLRATFPPLLVLSISLSLILVVWTPSARAQVSSFENAEGEISGTVLLETDKRPAPQAAVSLSSRAAGIFRSVLTDLEGHFKVQNLPRGTYDIAVDEDGYEAAQTSAQLDGPSAKLVVYLKSRPGAIRSSRYSISVRELKIPGKAQDEFQKGLERVAKNDLTGSLPHFAKATQAFPMYFEAYYNMGLAQMSLGRTDEAGQAFQASIDLSGGRYALAEFGYGYLLCQQGRPGEAEKIIRRGLEVEDASPEGYVVLSEALTQLNRLEEAEKSAREALLRNPNFAGAYLALADVQKRKGGYRAEIQDLDTYLKLQPSGPACEQVRRAREMALRRLAKTDSQDRVSPKQQ
jgi:tetratricopeptide (TPR) repeat protein